MTTPFEENFGSYLSASRDYNCYLAAKGYVEDDGCYYWQPQDPTDFDSLEYAPNYAPGAMRSGELDEYDYSNVGEF